MVIIGIKSKVLFVALAMVLSGFVAVAGLSGHVDNIGGAKSISSVQQNTQIGQYPDGNNAQGGAYDPYNQELYITNSFSDNVTVINAFSNISVANISVGSEPLGITYVPYNHDMYVNNHNSNNISIISSVNNTVVANISLPGNPEFSVYDPQNETLYVSGYNFGTGAIWIINVTNNTIMSIPGIPPGNTEGVAFDPYNGYVYFADNTYNQVYALSPSGAIEAYISVGQGPYGLALDPINKMLYVTDQDINSLISGYPKEYNVTIINTVNNTVVKSVVPGKLPEGVAYDPANGYIYIANSMSANISVLNPATESIIQTLPAKISVQNGSSAMVYDPVLQQMISVNDISTIDATLNYNSAGGYAAKAFNSASGAQYITFDASNRLLYVAGGSNVVSVYSLNGKLVASILVSSTVNSVLYVSTLNTVFASADNGSSPDIVMIDPVSNTVTANISLTFGQIPEGMAYDSLNGTLFVSMSANNAVDVVNPVTHKQITKIGVGESPTTLTYSNVTNQIYESNSGDENINIINASTYKVVVPYFVPVSDPSQAIYDPYTNSIYIANTGNDSMFVINESDINYQGGHTTFGMINVGSPQQSIAINPANGLVYIVQSGTENITIFNPLLNETVGSINSPTLAGAGYLTYIPGEQILLAADPNGYVEEISPAQTYTVVVSVGNLVPKGETWNLQIQPSQDSALAQVYNSSQQSNQSVILQLPDGTYSMNLSFSSGDVTPIHTYFVVNGSLENFYFDSQYNVTFREHGLPSGQSWFVSMGPYNESSSTSTIQLKFPTDLETYDAYISGSGSYKPYPSSLSVTVARENTSINVFFQSPHNQTYGAISSTIDVYNNISYPGDSYIPVNSSFSSLLSAFDPSLGFLFTPVISKSSGSWIDVYNISGGYLIDNSYTPFWPHFGMAISTYYDPINSLLYVIDALNNNLSWFYPSNGTAGSSIHLPGTLDNAITSIGNYVYVENSTGTVFAVNSVTNSVTNYSVTNGEYPSPVVLIPYRENLIMLNYTGSLVELNLSTSTVHSYALPSGFDPFQVISGKPGTLYVSGNGKGYIEVFNESTDEFTGTIDLNGTAGGNSYSGNNVTGGVYDPANGYMYFSSLSVFNTSAPSNFTVVNPATGEVVSSFPGLNLSSAITMVYIPSSQKIYAVGIDGDILSVISPQTYYNVTVKENGLPAGTSWKITLSNGETYNTTGTSITFLVENDTQYTYTLTSGNKSYSGVPGHFLLSGSAGQVQATFTLLKYTVDIKETGLASGTKWFVQVNGTTYNSTTDEISIQLPNGTYPYSVNSITGYSVTNGTGNVTVSGGATVQVKFSSTSTGLPLADIVIIAGVVVVVGIIGAAAYIFRIRGRK